MKVSFLNLMNRIYEKPTADITLKDERLKAFTFIYFFNIYSFIWLHQVLVAACGI